MGMAASQARFLALTARKTNVEYEGQQINQARTALANQSSLTFNRLLALEVPTAPSVSDYKSTSYTFSDGLTEDTITNIQTNTDPSTSNQYPYLVTYKHDTTKYTSFNTNKLSGPITSNNQDSSTNSEYPYVLNYSNGQTLLKEIHYDTLTNSDTDKLALETIKSKYSNLTDNVFYSYNDSNQTYYISATDLYNYNYDSSGKTKPYDATAKLQTYYAANIQSYEESTSPAILSQDSTGRYTSMTINDGSANGTTYSLNYNIVQDDDAYQDAMNNYNYEKALYDKEIEDINAKTEELQIQDRTLELKLKQLDTEQKAITTEQDSVKKVIEKSVEMVFKTFA